EEEHHQAGGEQQLADGAQDAARDVAAGEAAAVAACAAARRSGAPVRSALTGGNHVDLPVIASRMRAYPAARAPRAQKPAQQGIADGHRRASAGGGGGRRPRTGARAASPRGGGRRAGGSSPEKPPPGAAEGGSAGHLLVDLLALGADRELLRVAVGDPDLPAQRD